MGSFETRSTRGGAATQSVAHLERYYARELGVDPTVWSEPGRHILSSPRRTAPSWWGFLLPLLYVERRGVGVLSVEAALLTAAREALNRRPQTEGNGMRSRESDVVRTPDLSHDPLRPTPGAEGGRSLTAPRSDAPHSDGGDAPALRALLDLATARRPGAASLLGYALYCEPGALRPCRTSPVHLLETGDPEWREMRRHFDGPVWVVRAPDGAVAAWSAVKLKDPVVREISVVTNPGYRGRGLARAVVSAAAKQILATGGVPLFVHGEENLASARVARALGFRRFARQAHCSVGPEGVW